MNRRTLIAATCVALINPFARRAVAQESRQTVDTSDFSELQVIDSGLTLVDQSLRAKSEGTSLFLAEIRHDYSDVFDTPSFTQSFLDEDGNIVGEGRVHPVVGFMRTGESDFLVGQFVDGFDPNFDEWDSYQFKYVNGDWPGQIQIQYTYNPWMEITEISSEEKTPDSYAVVVDSLNVSGVEMTGGTCTLAVRDSRGHFVGYVQDRIESTIPDGKKARFRPGLSRHLGGTFNPFEFIGEAEDYSVEIIVSGRAY